MQLRLSQPFSVGTKVFSFRQALSVALTTITTGGAFAVVAFGTRNFKDSIIKSLDRAKKALLDTTLLNGINKLGATFHSWGTTVVATKDDFKEWVDKYLNPSGFKSGAVELYQKLKDWAIIVYEWFRDKFWPFIKNIPKMVENWKQLRLSLFKWGTFLGGGGGSALWAMFGSGDNWDRLSALMDREDFGEMMSTFSELMEKNSETFKNMGQEEMEEIIEKYLESPEEAHEAAKELLEKQKEMAEEEKKAEKEKEQKDEEEKEKKDEEKEPPQLEQEQIQEAFSSAKAGKPKSNEEIFGSMVGEALSGLADRSAYDFVAAKHIASQQMKAYLKLLEEDVEKEKKSKKKDTVKQKFLAELKEGKNEKELVDALSKVAEEAYENYVKKFPRKKEDLSQEFVNSFNKRYTNECKEDEEGCGTANLDPSSFVTSKKPIKKR